MKYHSTSFIVGLIIFCFLFIVPVQDVNARYCLNTRRAPEESKRAAILMFSALSKLFKSFEALEAEKLGEIEVIKKEMLGQIWEARELHKKIIRIIPDEKIDIEKIPSGIKDDFSKYKLGLPGSTKELAQRGMQEIHDLWKTLKSVKFGDDPWENRRNIRKINEQVSRFILLGVSISDLSALIE